MNPQDVQERLLGAFPDAQVEIAGADCNFSVSLVTSQFEGLRPVQRQQQVLALFQPELSDGRLHALTISASTPAEQAARQAPADGLIQL
ncbi:BolA family protein [Oceanobacter mangrovi]|uniref:BolA family protein n=1 Tax=Oceanobacter mangrovi TaxID=2862510 RepID=UPI001C8F0D7A|nr:BolA/IbaG family iron-sulfur metabolism protein [Oceanobacter mangrovi]